MFDRNSFEEIQVLGKYYWVHHFEAKILPDRYFVKDLIEMEGGRWEEITEDEYLNFKIKCEESYTLKD